MSNLQYLNCDIYDKWKVRVLYKKQFSEDPSDFKITYQFLYPYTSGYYRGKWTYHPIDMSKFPEEVQKFCKETWTDRFKEDYKKWRESVGPWVK